MRNNRVYRPVFFGECGCRFDLVDNCTYEATPCKFHEHEIENRVRDQMIFGNDMSEERLR